MPPQLGRRKRWTTWSDPRGNEVDAVEGLGDGHKFTFRDAAAGREDFVDFVTCAGTIFSLAFRGRKAENLYGFTQLF